MLLLPVVTALAGYGITYWIDRRKRPALIGGSVGGLIGAILLAVL